MSQSSIRIEAHLDFGYTSIAAKMPESVSEKFSQFAHSDSFLHWSQGDCGAIARIKEVSLI